MDPRNIIVRMPNWIGDLVMATPILIDLRKKFPSASITAMCASPLSDLLKTEQSLDELYSFSRPKNSFLRRIEERNITLKMKAGKYDLGILLTNSFSSAWLFWQGGVKRRIGFRKSFIRRFFLTDALPYPQERLHQVDIYKKLLLPLGIPLSQTAPRLCLNLQEIQEAKELLYQRGYKKGKKLVGINPGAAYGSAKCWPPERFSSLAKKLLQDVDLYLVFFGDGTTFSLIKEIAQGLPPRAINLAGVTSLRELASLIKEVDLLITNDSGPMHIAAAFNTPLIALFGSTDDYVTGPYGQKEVVINKRPSCSPCMKRVCPIDFRCMKEISVEEVAEKALAILKEAHV